jgi:hypothetical protein
LTLVEVREIESVSRADRQIVSFLSGLLTDCAGLFDLGSQLLDPRHYSPLLCQGWEGNF